MTGILARGGDPLCWSVALARKHLRQTMRRALAEGRPSAETLAEGLAQATADGYERLGSKKARDWPHQKREKPPGAPKIREATAEEVRRAKRLRKQKATE